MRGDFGAPKFVLPPNDDAPPLDDPRPLGPPSSNPPRPGSPSVLHSRVRARPAWKGTAPATNPPVPLPSPDELRLIAARHTNNPDDPEEIDRILTDMMEVGDQPRLDDGDDDMPHYETPRPSSPAPPMDIITPGDGYFARSSLANPPP